MLRPTLIVVMVLLAPVLLAQTPHIEKVEPVISYPKLTLDISGSGFSNTPGNLQVWFGHVKGTILSPGDTRIRVEVPPQARLGHVEVINTSSGRSGKSSGKFMLNFSGVQPFANNFTATSFENADAIFDLCACDFDGDGRPDIAGSKFRDLSAHLMLLINQSTTQANSTTLAFSQTSVPLSAPTNSLACGDLNGDGKPEIVATRGGTQVGNRIYIFHNTSTAGNVSFAQPVELFLDAGDFAREVAIHDLNRDGRPDIVVSNTASNSVYIYENLLSSASIVAGQFGTRKISLGGAAANSQGLDVADFSGDGWPDIAVTPFTTANKVLIFRNPADGTLNFPTPTSTNVGNSQNIVDIASADFNNDGRMDFVVSDRNGRAFVYTNRDPGNLVFQSVNGTTGFLSPEAWGVDVGDVNGDGFPDFVVGNRTINTTSVNPQVNIFINNGASTPLFTPTTIVTPKYNWFVRVGDFDGDAKPDIAVASTNNSDKHSIDIIRNRNCHKPVILNEDPLTICNGQNITLQAVPIPAVTFTWSTGATGPSAPISFSNAGTITVTAAGEGGGCSAQTSITVNQGTGTAAAKPTLSGPEGVCAGSAISLSTGTVSGATYIWTGPNDLRTETASPTLAVTGSASLVHAGNYTVRLKTGDCLSDVSDPKPITVVEPASFSITSNRGNSGVCTGQSVTLSVNPVAGYTYQWKKGGTNIGGQTNPSLTLNPVAAGDAGNYTVLISHQTISCSSETGPFTLSVVNAPVASFTTAPEQICVGTEVSFNASASTFDNSFTPNYLWEFGDQLTGSGVTTTHTYVSPQSSAVAKLTISYAGVADCSNSTTKTLNINAATPPAIAAEPEVTEICSDGSESVVLSVSGDFISYLWSINTNNTGPSITVKAPGTYSVTTVDANNCSGKAEITLGPKAECSGGAAPPILIRADRIFTPNGDGKNEYWEILDIENYPDCIMSIFDGRGMRVHEMIGYPAGPNSGWDGVSNVTNSPVPDGTYYFVLGCPNGSRATGSVLIVR